MRRVVASEKEEGRERDEREKNWSQGRRVEMTDWPASFRLERNSVEEDMVWCESNWNKGLVGSVECQDD